MRTRPVLALLLLILPAGCLGDAQDDRIAQPTVEPIEVPRPTPAPRPVPVNLSDPGYVMSGSWRMGDAWDYVSNESNVRRVRVLDQRQVAGVTLFLLEESTGKEGGRIEVTSRTWVDPRVYTVINTTDQRGNTETYQPGKALRFFRNGTYLYNSTMVDPQGNLVHNLTTRVQARLHGPHDTLQFPWGFVEARRIEEQRDTRTRDLGNSTVVQTQRWVHVDYLNDLQYDTAKGERYKLTAARVGEFRRGTIAT